MSSASSQGGTGGHGNVNAPHSTAGKSAPNYVVNGSILLCVAIVGPAICRFGDISSPDRCLIVIASVLLLQLFQVMPLYCTALGIPVLGTACAVFGKEMGILKTSIVLIGNVFNHISFLVMGALVISSVVSKCELERRFVKKLMTVVGSIDSACFLLSLMFGTLALSSVLFSGSVLMIAAVKPLVASSTCSPEVAKRILLGIGFAANLGSMWFPISSPLNLIVISILKQFDHSVDFSEWCVISIPVSCLILLFTWLMLNILYQVPSASAPQADAGNAAASQGDDAPALSISQWSSLLLSVLITVLISVFPEPFQNALGHPAILSLAFIMIIFGSGFLSKEEFKELDWDLLVLVGGTNVMAFLTRETGLAEVLTARLIESDVPFEAMQFWMLLGILLLISMICATLLSHQLTGVVLVPILCAIGVRFQSTELVVVLCALAIPCSMGLPHVSFDNLAAMATSEELPNSNKALRSQDFHRAGNIVTVISLIVIISMGYPIGMEVYGPPAPLAISGDTEYTPKELKPSKGPRETKEVNWSERTPNWKSFLKKPDYKAFAVGKMEKGQRTRAWGAAWGHETQEAANKDALASCSKVAKNCRIVYPPAGKMKEHPKDALAQPQASKKDAPEDPPASKEDPPEDPPASNSESPEDSKKDKKDVAELQARTRGFRSNSRQSDLRSQTAV